MAACEGGDIVDDVVAIGDFHFMRFEGISPVVSDDDRGFRVVLRHDKSFASSS